MCAQRRFRSDCAYAQSDQNLCWAHFWIAKHARFIYAHNDDSDQTVRMRAHVRRYNFSCDGALHYSSVIIAPESKKKEPQYMNRIFVSRWLHTWQLFCHYLFLIHYENTPFQIYWKFYHQTLKVFRWKILICLLFPFKTKIVGTH